MKTIFTKSLAIGSIALLMLASCKKDETKVVATNGKAGALQASSSSIVLTKAELNNTAVTFNFTAADFGYKAAITNTLQIDAKSDNFASPKEYVVAAGKLTQSFTTLDFNALMLALGLPTGSASDVSVRIKSQLSAGMAPVYSNTMAISVTPFSLVTYAYVPGAYQGWNPASADSLASAKGDGVYTGVINFTAGNDQFLITSAKNWNNKWATTDGPQTGSPAVYSTEYVTGGGNNFYAVSKTTVDPAVNIYTSQVVLDDNKHTLTITPTLWSVVGDASPGGWPGGSGYQSDTDMKFDNGTQTWWVKVDLKAGGAIKFRMNHDWGKNYGSVTTAGVLDTADNNNISITVTGTYLVTINLNTLAYTLVKQ